MLSHTNLAKKNGEGGRKRVLKNKPPKFLFFLGAQHSGRAIALKKLGGGAFVFTNWKAKCLYLELVNVKYIDSLHILEFLFSNNDGNNLLQVGWAGMVVKNLHVGGLGRKV